ncbi:MAG: metallophosphoesterase family protein [Clostridia bacterium]|nr:metallophosphoesterase family protein [Clostridia bacterium]
MKILLISDEESAYLWDHYQPGRLEGIDLILSCGDLSPEYLSFLVTMSTAPVFYVHGNHDGKYAIRPPEGCECIEDRIVNFGGLRILGLGGCVRYSPGDHQYTEYEMSQRIRKLKRQLKKSRGVDLVITHAPVRGLGDDDTFAHRGFEAFHTLLEEHKPRYWAYGHVHMRYGHSIQRTIQHGETTLINACEKYILEIPQSFTGQV